MRASGRTTPPSPMSSSAWRATRLDGRDQPRQPRGPHEPLGNARGGDARSRAALRAPRAPARRRRARSHAPALRDLDRAGHRSAHLGRCGQARRRAARRSRHLPPRQEGPASRPASCAPAPMAAAPRADCSPWPRRGGIDVKLVGGVEKLNLGRAGRRSSPAGPPHRHRGPAVQPRRDRPVHAGDRRLSDRQGHVLAAPGRALRLRLR